MEQAVHSDGPERDADVLIRENRLHPKDVRCQITLLHATDGIDHYSYDDLGTPAEDKTFLKKHLDKKRFRLLELRPGLLSNPQIVCEIFEVELDITDGTIVRVLDNTLQDTDTESQPDQEAQAKSTLTPNMGSANNDSANSANSAATHHSDARGIMTTNDTKEASAAVPMHGVDSTGLNDGQVSEQRPPNRVDMIRMLKEKEKEMSERRHKEHVNYEALSWRWGNEKEGEFAIMVLKGKRHFRKRVSRTLGLALKYLRFRAHPRVIWIDALCINQGNQEERSIQVAMMDRLYTGASQVSIWLGEDEQGDESRIAINFIKNDVSVLKEFDKLCRDKKYTDQWKALLVLMQREWFSRRWVVQEIALAKKATVYYGPDKIGWRQLATAIGLFVEVESATHRLSELMKSDERFNLIPNWFEHISGLPASLLVNESSRVFRDYKREEDELSNVHVAVDISAADVDDDPDPWMLEDSTGEDPTDDAEQNASIDASSSDTTGVASGSDGSDSGDDVSTPYPVSDKMRRSLLTLEYLVTSLAIFDCGPPHDSLYALIAISRDAFPSPPLPLTERNKEVLLTDVMETFVERKPFPLDYNMSYPDVCRCFVEFCIRRRTASDQTTALDILCRPWSKDWSPKDGDEYFKERDTQKPVRILDHVPKRDWRVFNNEEKKMYEESMRRNNDPRRPHKLTYIDCKIPRSKISEDSMGEWKSKVLGEGDKVILRKDIHRKWALWLPHGQLPTGVNSADFWEKWQNKDKATSHSQPRQDRGKPNENPKVNLGLPSWVARISNARFDIFRHPGMDMVKMGRKNADPLVGNLVNNAGIYRAAQLTKVDSKSLRFKKRETQPNGPGHYSLYVKGFIIDKVKHVSHVSSAGVIPESWLRLAKWDKAVNPDQFGEDPGEPPDNFWRTLVADRGTSSNPPYYYARACRETVMRGGLRSGAVDTMALKSYERNSIIAEFCRRVQSVIWNRAMITTESGKLGLVSNCVKEGDLICILYGCSVPVILRYESRKEVKMRVAEQVQDSIEAMRSVLKSCVRRRAMRAQYRKRQEEDDGHAKFVQDALKKHLDQRRERMLRRKTGRLVLKEKDPIGSPSNEPRSVDNGRDPESNQGVRAPTAENAKFRARGSHFNQIKDMNELKKEELLTCWPSATKGRDGIPDEDHLSEDDFTGNDKDKETRNKHRWGKIWEKRVTEEKAEGRDQEEEDEGDEQTNTERNKEKDRRPWRQEMADRRDPWRHYTLQGEAYVHELMDGEAVSDKFYKQIPDHLFEIR